jgi:hypothetical protein
LLNAIDLTPNFRIIKKMSKWEIFVDLCGKSFHACGFQDQLIQECHGHADIAWATFYHLGNHSISWLHEPVPALAGATPVSLIASGKADLVRDCLLRFP